MEREYQDQASEVIYDPSMDNKENLNFENKIQMVESPKKKQKKPVEIGLFERDLENEHSTSNEKSP